jgi:hypothetical protein
MTGEAGILTPSTSPPLTVSLYERERETVSSGGVGGWVVPDPRRRSRSGVVVVEKADANFQMPTLRC